MLDFNKILKKRFSFEGNINIEELKGFVKNSYYDSRRDILCEYLDGKDVKKLAKEYHIAESRITNLMYVVLDNFYKAVLCEV